MPSGEGGFLYARVVTSQLREQPLNSSVPGWEDRLAATVTAAFDRDLRALTGTGAAEVAAESYGPVVVRVHLIEHPRLTVDHQPFERRTRFRVAGQERLAARRPDGQLLDRRRDRPRRQGERWENWWLAVTRKAIQHDHLVHHGRPGRPGSPGDDQTRLLHASCQRAIHARHRRNTAINLHARSVLA